MKALVLLRFRDISISVLYYLIFFNIVNLKNQLTDQVLINNKMYGILPMIDGCKDVFGCKRTEIHHTFNLEFGICEQCESKPLEVECPSISVANNSYQLLSFTNSFDKEFSETSKHNKHTSITEREMFNGTAVLFSGKFVDFSRVENCALDKDNQIELLQEIYLIYNQYDSNKDLILNIVLKNQLQAIESKTLELISNWEISNKKSNHAIYAYTKFKEKMNNKNFEINYTMDNQMLNKIWPSIKVFCNSDDVRIFDQVQLCMRISCRKLKKEESNNSNRQKGKRATINDIITSVNILKSKARSENDYLLYVNIFIKTLLKSLKRKTERGKISIGCSNKMVSWVKELCEILKIRTDENSNIGRYISEFAKNTEKELNQNRKTTDSKSIAELKQNAKFIEAELEDYEKLEEELKEF